MSNSLDMGVTPSYLASHPDPSCLHLELVVSGGLKVNVHTFEGEHLCFMLFCLNNIILLLLLIL